MPDGRLGRDGHRLPNNLPNYPAPDGVLFSIDFFVYFFVSLSARLRENGWTDLHEIFREGVE